MVNTINETVLNYLPIDESYYLSFTSLAKDKLNKKLWVLKRAINILENV